jgi:hypothetical protein
MRSFFVTTPSFRFPEYGEVVEDLFVRRVNRLFQHILSIVLLEELVEVGVLDSAYQMS